MIEGSATLKEAFLYAEPYNNNDNNNNKNNKHAYAGQLKRFTT
jgi:hypothetical protein